MCKSNDEPPIKIDLQKESFEEININLNNKDEIIFKKKEWLPSISTKINSNGEEDENEEKEDDENQETENQEKIKNLKKEINDREIKKNNLKEKLRLVEDKIEEMEKILIIDMSEQNYLNDLSNKLGKDEHI